MSEEKRIIYLAATLVLVAFGSMFFSQGDINHPTAFWAMMVVFPLLGLAVIVYVLAVLIIQCHRAGVYLKRGVDEAVVKAAFMELSLERAPRLECAPGVAADKPRFLKNLSRSLTALLFGGAVSAWLVIFYSYSHTIANTGSIMLLLGGLGLIIYQHRRLGHCPNIAISYVSALCCWSFGNIMTMFSLATLLG